MTWKLTENMTIKVLGYVRKGAPHIVRNGFVVLQKGMESGTKIDSVTLWKRYVEWIRGSVMGQNMFYNGAEGYSTIK